MADPGNGQSLLGGGGGEECAGAAEQNGFPFSGFQAVQKIAAEGDGTASAAGAPGVDILVFPVKNQGAAVLQPPAQAQAVPPCQL